MGFGRRGIFTQQSGGEPTPIDIDINGQPFAEGVTANQDIPVVNEADTQLGAKVGDDWVIADITLTQPNGDEESKNAGIALSCTQIADILNSDLIAQLSAAQVTAIYEGRVSMNVVEYTASDTYVKPSNLLWATVSGLGAGGGGGSGRRGGAESENTGGGRGAGGGALVVRTFQASDIPDNVTITVSSGGTGGAAQVSNSTNGNTGAAGSASSFGSLLVAAGGLGGIGGTTAAPAGQDGGAVSACTPLTAPFAIGGGRGGAASNSSSTAGSPTAGGMETHAAMGGAGGGGNSILNAPGAGGNGGTAIDDTGALNTPAAGGPADGSNGSPGTDNWSMQIGIEWPCIPTNTIGVGTSGGGGGGQASSSGGAGGAPGQYGVGGSGGGASVNDGPVGGAGGNGGNGFIVIAEYLAT